MRRPRWKRIIILLVILVLVSGGVVAVSDYYHQRGNYESQLGDWRTAVETGNLIKYTGQVSYYDVTGDGIPDFEITMKWNKPHTWRYMRDGESYG